MTVLMVVLGAVVGAPARYLIDRSVQERHDKVFPWGTLVVNATACLLLGFVGALALPAWAFALIVTGFLGTMSTYSAFGYATAGLLRDGDRLQALANAALTIGAGLGAAEIGSVCARALTG